MPGLAALDTAPIGRFAPSPSGPLHAGSLLTALASYIDVRARGGQWLLRIDDIDSERSNSGAVTHICHALDAHGLHHDGDLIFQSRRTRDYDEALKTLISRDQVYGCACTRAQLRERAARAGHPRYDRHCAALALDTAGNANRLRVDDRRVQWQDGAHRVVESVQDTVGDYVLKRRDGVPAYQLAIVVDDGIDKVTSVVRGDDLRDNAGRQVYLQQLLRLRTPRYLHVPLVLGHDGRKLSKSNGAAAVDASRPVRNLLAAWAQLKQPAPLQHFDSPSQFLTWACGVWQPALASTRHC